MAVRNAVYWLVACTIELRKTIHNEIFFFIKCLTM